jgi:hypothetical protein
MPGVQISKTVFEIAKIKGKKNEVEQRQAQVQGFELDLGDPTAL